MSGLVAGRPGRRLCEPSYFLPSCPHGHSAVLRASCRQVISDTPHHPRIEWPEKSVDDRCHADLRLAGSNATITAFGISSNAPAT